MMNYGLGSALAQARRAQVSLDKATDPVDLRRQGYAPVYVPARLTHDKLLAMTMGHTPRLLLLSFVFLPVTVSCSSKGAGRTSDSGSGGSSDGGSDVDGSAGMGGSSDSLGPADSGGSVAGTGGNASGTGGGGATGGSSASRPCKHEIDNPSCWSARNVDRMLAVSRSLFGGIFDGRYILFVNATTGFNGASLRIDTQSDFAPSGWDTFDPSVLGSKGNRGGVFDGRYVYLTPTGAEHNGALGSTFDTVAARYDTQAAFAARSSWSSFDLTTASGTADLAVPGFRGAAFDGRYVYFAPGGIGTTVDTDILSGKVARVDTQAAFDAASSWTTFDLAGVDANATSFSGLVFDGRYLYFVPYEKTNARVARFDTQADFSVASSWSLFDPTTVNQYAAGFTGGVFDGRYVTFVPARASVPSFKCVVARYDTQGSFTAASSWSAFDTAVLKLESEPRFTGGAFDGRYVYLVPSSDDLLVRNDPEAPFSDVASWTVQDMSTVANDPSASGFTGAVFDGHYLYFVPTGVNLLRFDAREPGPMPMAIHGGSFY
jgi:hypothetical protein